MKNFSPVYLYLLIILILEIYFWINRNNNGLEFGILVYYIIFPIATLMISIIYGKKVNDSKKYLLILFFGIISMMFEYSTYSLANMLTFNKVNLPEVGLLLIYGVISLIGILIGNCVRHNK